MLGADEVCGIVQCHISQARPVAKVLSPKGAGLNSAGRKPCTEQVLRPGHGCNGAPSTVRSGRTGVGRAGIDGGQSGR